MKHNSYDFTASGKRSCKQLPRDHEGIILQHFYPKNFRKLLMGKRNLSAKRTQERSQLGVDKCTGRSGSNGSKSQLVFYFSSKLMYAKEIFGYRFNTYTTSYKIFMLPQKRMCLSPVPSEETVQGRRAWRILYRESHHFAEQCCEEKYNFLIHIHTNRRRRSGGSTVG